MVCLHLKMPVSEFSEGLLLLFSSSKLNISCKVEQWPGSMGVVPDKSLIKVGESNELLDLLFRLGCWPVHYPHNLNWIHLYFPFGDDKSEVFNALLLKFTLVWFEVQLMFLKPI